MYCIISDESRPSDKWGAGRHPDPEIRGPGLEKEFSRPCSPLFGPKSGGEGGGPPLDPPLIVSQNFLTTGRLYLQGALLLTEVLKERDAQIEMKNGKLDAEKIREEHLLRLQQRVTFPIS